MVQQRVGYVWSGFKYDDKNIPDSGQREQLMRRCSVIHTTAMGRSDDEVKARLGSEYLHGSLES